MRRVCFIIVLTLFYKLVFASQIQVVVSVEPQRFIVERIGGESIKVLTIVPPGRSPHSYEPTPLQIKELGNSLVWFTLGIEFERVLFPRIRSIYKNLLVVDTSEGIKRRIIKEDEILEKGEHRHKEDEILGKGEHRHEELGAEDPHIWLSPRLVKQQAKIVLRTLVKIDPSRKEIYERNYRGLVDDLDKLHNEILEKLKPYRGRKFLVYHPAFGYFADDYGLKQVAIEIRGREPSPSQLNKIIRIAKENGIKTVFVQEGFSKKSAEAVAKAIGGKVIEINPLSSDYINMMRKIADALVEGF